MSIVDDIISALWIIMRLDIKTSIKMAMISNCFLSSKKVNIIELAPKDGKSYLFESADMDIFCRQMIELLF